MGRGARSGPGGERSLAMCFRLMIIAATIAALMLVVATAALGAKVTPTSIDGSFGGQQLDSAVWFHGGSESDITISQDRGRVTIAAPGGAAQSFFAGVSTI